MKLERLTLTYKDECIKQKEVDLTRDFTFITGSSQKGKSAILELIDYCLFSKRNTVPEGMIKNKLLFAMLTVNYQDNILSLVRDASTDRMQIIKGSKIAYEDLITLTFEDKENIQDEFEELLKLQIHPELKKQLAIEQKFSLRYQVSYNLLAQNIVANKDVLFRNYSDSIYVKYMRKYFNVYMGIDNPENMFYKVKIDTITKRKKQIEEAINLKREQYKMNLDDVVKQINLLRRMKGLNEIITEKQLHEEFKMLDIYQISPSQDSVSESINSLKQELNIETEKLLDIQKEIEEIENYKKRYAQSKKNNVSINEKCPICETDLEKENKFIYDYNKDVDKYNLWVSQLEDFNSNGLKQTQLVYLEKEKKQKEKVNDLEVNLRSMQKSVVLVDDVQYLLEYSKLMSKLPHMHIEELKEELRDIEEQLVIFKDLYTNVYSKEKLFEETLTKNLTDIVRNFEIEEEFKEYKLIFDIKKFDLFFDETKKIKLSQTGSGANWEAMHLALNIALIKTAKEFSENSKIFNFLIIDQPTQVYFESKEAKEKAVSVESDSVRMLFKNLIEICKINKIQLIILDHIKPSHFTNSNKELEQDLEAAQIFDWIENDDGLLSSSDTIVMN